MRRYISTILLIGVLVLAGYGREIYADDKERTFTQIDQETAREMMAKNDDHVIVDVRRQEEYDAGHIPGAILIPNESIICDSPEALPDYDQVILIYCRSGNRSKQAAQKLASMGYTRVYEFGGIMDWEGEIVTETEETEASLCETLYTLRFSSFSGGGYEYSVKVDDPSIVSCETRYEFEENVEEIDGASYDYVVSLTGCKEGSTTVRVYGRSPIIDNENRVYTANVDEELRITLTPIRALSTFHVYRNGDIRYDSYQINLDTEGYQISIDEGPERSVSMDEVNVLMEVIESYDLVSWDGFSESRDDVLDGEGFRLEFTLTDGSSVQASGDNAFPDHYFDAMGAIWDILTRMAEEESA